MHCNGARIFKSKHSKIWNFKISNYKIKDQAKDARRCNGMKRCSHVTDCRHWSRRRGVSPLEKLPRFFLQEIYFFKIQKCFIQKCIFQKKVSSVRSEKCIFHTFVFVLPLNNNDSHFKILCSHLHSLWFWHNEEIKLEDKIILGAKDQKWLFIKSEEKIM